MFELDDYYPRLLTRVVDGLAASGEEVDLVFISVRRPPGATIDQKGGVKVHYTGLVPYDRYDHLLRSCDAIISDNIIQTSVSKAIVMGTPHLVIQNMTSSEMPYRYNMFPIKLLFPEEREYAQIVDVAEYGDAAGIVERLPAILKNGYYDEHARDNRLEYLRRLNQLSLPSEILDSIIATGANASVTRESTTAQGER